MSSILEKNNITPELLGLLMFIKLNSSGDEYISQTIKEYGYECWVGDTALMDILDKYGFVKYVKSGKKDPWYRVRLTENSEKILKDMNQKPLHELAEFGFDYLSQEYKRIGQQEKIKNKTKSIFYLSEFLYHKENYTERMLKAVLSAYVESFDYERQKYMFNTLALVFRSSNAYASKWSPEDCPLVDFINKNEQLIKNKYKNV